MPSFRCKIKKLRFQGILTDKETNRILDALDKADKAEKTAEWIFRTSKSAKCSNCGHIQFTNGEDTTKNTLIHKALYHYCPMCGAKMKGVE